MNVKQVIVVRKDLNMSPGKLAAQVCHASMGAIFKDSFMLPDPREGIIAAESNSLKCIPVTDVVEEWFGYRFTKVCLGCKNEAQLLRFAKEAEEAGLTFSLIKDAGLTVFAGIPTYTCLGIGPHESDDINKITGKLRLL